MNDRENQTSSDNTTPKYRALVDGTGYRKDAIFSLQTDVTLTRNNEGVGIRLFGASTCALPVFMETQLMASPDFELVEEYWEPGDGEGFDWLHNIRDEFGLGIESCTRYKNDDEIFFKGKLANTFLFRPGKDAQNCLDEIKALLKKRSKESRRLNADTKAD